MVALKTTLPDEQATLALGGALAQSLEPGLVIYLRGELGAGKTTLARAIARSRGVGTDATSPTFGLVHHYRGPGGEIYHVDCFRLRHPDEAADLDWQTLTASDLLLIEWPERAGAWAPPASVRLRISHVGDDLRRVDLE